MANMLDRAYIAVWVKAQKAKKAMKEMWEEEKGSTSSVVIEIVMIGMVLVLGYMFRKQIGDLFVELWNKLVGGATSSGSGDPSVGSMTNPFS